MFFLCQQISPELLEIFIRQKNPYWHRYYSPRVFVQTHSERMSKWAEPGISMLSFWWVIPTKPKTSTSRALPESYKERIPWKNNKCTTPRATQATLSTTKFPLTHWHLWTHFEIEMLNAAAAALTALWRFFWGCPNEREKKYCNLKIFRTAVWISIVQCPIYSPSLVHF